MAAPAVSVICNKTGVDFELAGSKVAFRALGPEDVATDTGALTQEERAKFLQDCFDMGGKEWRDPRRPRLRLSTSHRCARCVPSYDKKHGARKREVWSRFRYLG